MGAAAVIQHFFIRHGFAVDHQGGAELEGVDDFLSVDGGFVRGFQVRFIRIEDVEIPVLVDEQQVQAGHDGIPVNDALAENEVRGLFRGEGGAVVPVDGQDRPVPLGDAVAGNDRPVQERIVHARGGGAQLGRVLQGDGGVPVRGAPLRPVHPVALDADGRILVKGELLVIVKLVGKGGTAFQADGQGAEFAAVLLPDRDAQRIRRGGGNGEKKNEKQGDKSAYGR